MEPKIMSANLFTDAKIRIRQIRKIKWTNLVSKFLLEIERLMEIISDKSFYRNSDKKWYDKYIHFRHISHKLKWFSFQFNKFLWKGKNFQKMKYSFLLINKYLINKVGNKRKIGSPSTIFWNSLTNFRNAKNERKSFKWLAKLKWMKFFKFLHFNQISKRRKMGNGKILGESKITKTQVDDWNAIEFSPN